MSTLERSKCRETTVVYDKLKGQRSYNVGKLITEPLVPNDGQ